MAYKDPERRREQGKAWQQMRREDPAEREKDRIEQAERRARQSPEVRAAVRQKARTHDRKKRTEMTDEQRAARAAYAKSWYARNADRQRELARERAGKRSPDQQRAYYLENRAKLLAQEKARRLASPQRTLYWNARSSAKRNGIPFDLEISDIVVPDICPLLGIQIVWTGGGNERPDGLASIDRVIPALGYVKGNVWIISWRANRLKNNASLEELEMITAGLRRRLKPTD